MGNCITKQRNHGYVDTHIPNPDYPEDDEIYSRIDEVNRIPCAESLVFQTPIKNYILVAAIDFGTTFSGYAYSFRHDYERDKLKIYTNMWAHNSGLSAKAPSAVLIGPDRQVKAFGYEAHRKYNELIEREEAMDHLFFEKFKMMLFTTKNLNNKTLIRDISGKEMLAIDMFALVLGYLRNHLMQRLQNRDTDNILDENTIQWVLTVPAIWSEKAKQFMRYAADKGGIPSKHLILALEPEGASLYCKHLPQCITMQGKRMTDNALENGTKYIVLDIGGGTVDVTAHEIQRDGTLRELYQATGGCWGGTTIDLEFQILLSTIFGSDIISKINDEYPNEMIDVLLDFEMKKRSYEPGVTSHISIKCPSYLFEVYEKIHGVSIREDVKTTCTGKKVKFVRDKLLIYADTYEGFYTETLDKLVNHLRQLLHVETLSDITTLLLVGGFAESKVIKNSIVTNFPLVRVINPDDCSMAVLKGAVLFGHDQKAIRSRISKCSYGIGTHVNFHEGIHPETKKRIVNGIEICDDIFDIHVRLGERVEISQPRLEKIYHRRVQPDFSNTASLYVYASTSKSPMFVTDDSCTVLGCLSIALSGDKDEKVQSALPVDTDKVIQSALSGDSNTSVQSVLVSFHYVGTELGVLVRVAKTGKVLGAKFDFLC
ncbi:heat shock 70 kDa protein 12A-like isoform X1 [Mytilus galloprovincialis]|uniref:heat shock 70 kDa protein 12A-like isoform X1 n=1 Tax=Mytilus galloprovincialis TaxID=29158 RepID=UPI003F7C0186